MLLELRVRQLGVIEDVTVVLGPGVTALTGETGAGKTLIVDAIALLTGGPADPALVRPGGGEAVVEGRFSPVGQDGDAGEVVLTRVVPASGRSRAYADGRMVSAAQLAALGEQLVDLHGQHAHQSLLSPATQRDALDMFGGIDTTEVAERRRAVRALTEARAALGGDPRARARQLDLLAYQLGEIEAAGIEDPDEDAALQAEEDLLADAAGLVEAASAAWQALAGEDGITDRLGDIVAATSGRRPLAPLHQRLAAAQAELADVAAEARSLAETVEADPERLSRIGDRRRVLTELRRKYGGTLAEVLGYREQLRAQVEELSSHDRRAGELDAELEQARKELRAASERLWDARRAAAPRLSRAVEKELRALAMPRARFEVAVGTDPASDAVTWMLGANPGEAVLPLAKVASGGELARAMLAARLVLLGAAARDSGPGAADGARSGPATLVFDEVDAGIGGEAAVAVGRALAALGPRHQVLVVTHLAQVAAFARQHLVVAKEVHGGRTVSSAHAVTGEDRIVELARMLSGRPDSESARRHAAELLAASSPDG